MQEIVSDRSLRKYQMSPMIDGAIPFLSEAYFRSHDRDVLWQGQTKSNECFLEKCFPLFQQVIVLWSEHYALSIVLSLATLFWCSSPFLKQQPIIFFENGIENWQISSLLCLCCVRTVSWYARASVCSLQRGQLENSLGWLFHFNIMSSLVWKNSAIFCRRQRRQCQDPQANIQRHACAIKREPPLLRLELSISLCTCTVIRFHGRIPWQRVSKIIRTRRQWQRSSIGVSIGK